MLNARQDAREAEIVARAGQTGAVTVATNMAGRSTDIPLAPEVAERGGLHVICCQHNESRRIDRQLIGRCARQGDAGTAEMLVSLTGGAGKPRGPRWLFPLVGRTGQARPAWLVKLIACLPQLLDERRQRAQRHALLRQDARLEHDLQIGGAVK